MTSQTWRAKLSKPSPIQLAWILAGLILAGAAVWLAVSFIPGARDRSSDPGPSEAARQAFEIQTGVRIVLVGITAGGGMIDLRYQVIDADKALAVHDNANPPKIIDEASGRVLQTRWMNHNSDHNFRTGQTYYELILNQDGAIQPGSRVTVTFGDYMIEGIVVQ
jgi:hypothetical protein